MFGGLIGTVARAFAWKQRGDARLASSFAVSWLGVLSLRKAVGLLGPGPHVVRRIHGTNAPMKCLVAQRGQWPRNSDFVSFLLLSKIEANLLKSVAYKTLDIHVPLFKSPVV